MLLCHCCRAFIHTSILTKWRKLKMEHNLTVSANSISVELFSMYFQCKATASLALLWAFFGCAKSAAFHMNCFSNSLKKFQQVHHHITILLLSVSTQILDIFRKLLNLNFTTLIYFGNRKTDNNNNNEHINHPAGMVVKLTINTAWRLLFQASFGFVVWQMMTNVLRGGNWSFPSWGEKNKMHAWICKGLGFKTFLQYLYLAHEEKQIETEVSGSSLDHNTPSNYAALHGRPWLCQFCPLLLCVDLASRKPWNGF